MIGDFLIKYWDIILVVVAAAGAIVKMYYKVNSLDKDLKEAMDMIKQNKKDQEDSVRTFTSKLDEMHTTLTELKILNKLIIEDKIKKSDNSKPN